MTFPLGLRLDAAPGPAILVVGHFSRNVIEIEPRNQR
jgi:hypothetical protein